MAAIQFSCPKCGNNLLCFTCRLSHEVEPPSPKKEEWNFLRAKRYIINKGLEVFDDGNWIFSKLLMENIVINIISVNVAFIHDMKKTF